MLTVLLASCSTKQNTSRSRFWQSFVTRYNVYYNGKVAYDEGLDAVMEGNKDNFTEIIPFFAVGNEGTRGQGRGNLETAIMKSEKAIALHSIKVKPQIDPSKDRTPAMRAFLSKKEYNPFLKNCWLLMGKAQFYEGDFLNAASTFSYITRLYSTEPDVLQEARIWLARCYSNENWFYDAEDVLDKTLRDSIPRKLRADLAATQADLLVRQGRYADALPHLQAALKKAGGKLQKARIYYLMAQLEQQLGHHAEAYKYLSRVRRLNPPYRMALNAQVMQTQVLPKAGLAKREIARLRRMARSDKNTAYVEQIYGAIGNLYLHDGDTLHAIQAYEQGRTKGGNTTIERGIMLLRLADIYWDKGKYGDAQQCYTEALSLIDRKQVDYDEISRRSAVLDRLVPFTSTIELQDSLLALSEMSEADRNAAIDRTIAALVKQEKEEERARRKAEMGENTGYDTMTPRQSMPTHQVRRTGEVSWYFYDPQLVQQGKQDFKQMWGTRRNEDDWRRSNKTVVRMDDDAGIDYAAEDSITALNDSLRAADSGKKGKDEILPENDPHNRAYYMLEIPFSSDAKQSAHQLIEESLYEAGCIEKDQLEDFPLAQRTLERLIKDYPESTKRADALYQLYLLHARQGNHAKAESMKRQMASEFPDHVFTKRINDPDFLLLGRHGKAMEDSLYVATYEAYKARRNDEVARNFAQSTDRFPTGLNRPKFILVHALSRIGTAENKEIVDELTQLVKTYPKHEVSEMAGMIVNGLRDGRKVGSGTYDVSSLWERRSDAGAAALAGQQNEPQLLADRNVPYVFLAAYPQGDVVDNQLLYDFAHFNFTEFFVRHFEIEKVVGIQAADKAGATDSVASTAAAPTEAPKGLVRPQMVQFRIHGFRSFDEAHAYAQRVYADSALSRQLAHTRTFLISEPNLLLLGTRFSFADYQSFYDRHLMPIQPYAIRSLDDNIAPSAQTYEPQTQPIYPREVKLSRTDSLMLAVADSLLRAAQADTLAVPNEPDMDEPEEELYPIDEPVVRKEAPVEELPADSDTQNPLLPQKQEDTVPDEPATPQKPAAPEETYPEDDEKPEPAKPSEPETVPDEPAPAPETKPATPKAPETEGDEPEDYPDDEEGDDGEWYPE